MSIDFSEYQDEDGAYREDVFYALKDRNYDHVIETILGGREILPEEYHPFLVRVLESLRG